MILAVQRGGEALEGDEVELAAGDALLLRGTWETLERNAADPEVLLVDHPELVRRQAVPMGPDAKRRIVVLAAMILGLATGVAPPSIVALDRGRRDGGAARPHAPAGLPRRWRGRPSS